MPGEKLDFGRHPGYVPYDRIPEYMNRAKNFVFLPRWPEPQGRVVVEAALCGCNLITNENVGATSFPFDIGRSENFQNATGEFWDAVEHLA
jgi:glycosyltransferase involved in cell wall biosynthesis